MTTPISERAFANVNAALNIPNMGYILPLKVEFHPVKSLWSNLFFFKKQKGIEQSRNEWANKTAFSLQLLYILTALLFS